MFGFRAFNRHGVVVLDTPDFVCKVLGSLRTGYAATGSVTDGRFADGTPWYCVSPFAVSFPRQGGGDPLTVEISGTTLSWHYAQYIGDNNLTRDNLILYGIY